MAIEYSAISLNAVKGFVKTINEDFTLFISPSGDDEANSGLTVDSPWQTIHKALNYLSDIYITENAVVTISCAAGVYDIDKEIIINHECGGRIAIVGAEPLEMTLESVDDYIDTTGTTGDTTSIGSASEGGEVVGFQGIRRTGRFHGATSEDIIYTNGVAGDNAYGERFAMVCTVSGSTGALGVDDYVLIRGFSGGYESTDASLTLTPVDGDRRGTGIVGYGEAGAGFYPALTLTDTNVCKAGQNNTWNRPSQVRPTNRRHVLRYPRFAEPENWVQRFYAVGCHKVIGIGADVLGLGGPGYTGADRGRITLENKNPNRNPWNTAINGSGTNTSGTGVFTAGRFFIDGMIDYDRPTPASQNTSDVTESGAGDGNEFPYLVNAPSSTQQHDKIGYMPEPPTTTIRPAVGWEDSDTGGSGNTPTTRARENRTHGKFTVSGLRTIFRFKSDMTVSGNPSQQGTTRHGMKVTSSLYRLDNIVFKPRYDSKIANGDEWGVANEDNQRRAVGAIFVGDGSKIHHLGPNIGFTDWTDQCIMISGGSVRGAGVCFSSSEGAWDCVDGGKLQLTNATLTNCHLNTIRRSSNLVLNRSMILSECQFVNTETSNTHINDSAFLYTAQYSSNQNNLSNTVLNSYGSNIRIDRSLFHRFNTLKNQQQSCLDSNYNTYQESWSTAVTNAEAGNANHSFDAFIKSGTHGSNSYKHNHTRMVDCLFSGTGMQNNNRGDTLVNSQGRAYYAGSILCYNTYNHYGIVNYYGGFVDADQLLFWHWGSYDSSGSEGTDDDTPYNTSSNALGFHGPTTYLKKSQHEDSLENFHRNDLLEYTGVTNKWNGGEAYETDTGIDPGV